MRKQSHQTTTPDLLYRKLAFRDIWNFWPESWFNPLWKYAQFLTIVKFSLSSKKPPIAKTTSWKDNTKVSCTENWALEIFGIFDKNHGLTPLEICPIFNYSKMTFLSSKKPPIEKTTSWKDNTKVSCTENKARGIFGIFKQNHGLTWHFYRRRSLLLRK